MNLKSANKNKNALITGAGKRVGQAIAIALASDGWNVALHYNTTSPDETLAKIKAYGVKFCTIQADLNNLAEVERVLPQANVQLGEISLLINNASIFEKCSFAETNEDIFDRHMNINFKAPFFVSQAFAKQTTNGQIINLNDTRITDNKTTYFAYLHSKKALSELTKMLAVELAPQVRVNEVALGACDLPQSYDNKYLEERVAKLPLKKTINLSNIQHAITYLAEQNYLTGQTMFIDSGENLI